jgi:hypothetical protein
VFEDCGTKTKLIDSEACVLFGPKGTQVEPSPSVIIADFAHFVELTAYPQRSALEPLLTSD